MSGNVLKLKLLHFSLFWTEKGWKNCKKTNGGEQTAIFTSFQNIFHSLIKKRWNLKYQSGGDLMSLFATPACTYLVSASDGEEW